MFEWLFRRTETNIEREIRGKQIELDFLSELNSNARKKWTDFNNSLSFKEQALLEEANHLFAVPAFDYAHWVDIQISIRTSFLKSYYKEKVKAE